MTDAAFPFPVMAELTWWDKVRQLEVVPRWSTMRIIRRASVAEHSYFVMIYSLRIAQIIEWPVDRYRSLMWHAATHDLSETMTSDIPGPAKRMGMVVVDEGLIPEELKATSATKAELLIVKLADVMDQMKYLETETKLGNFYADHWKGHLWDQLQSRFDQFGEMFGDEVVQKLKQSYWHVI